MLLNTSKQSNAYNTIQLQMQKNAWVQHTSWAIQNKIITRNGTWSTWRY